jgi:hypothetical protein
MVSLSPTLLAPALTQRSLDPQVLLHAGSPHHGRLDRIALGVHQHPIQDQTQKLVTQRGRLLIPTRAEISSKCPDRGHLGGGEHAVGRGRVRLREIPEALPPTVDLREDHGHTPWRPGQREVLLQRLDLVLQLAPLTLAPPGIVMVGMTMSTPCCLPRSPNSRPSIKV